MWLRYVAVLLEISEIMETVIIVILVMLTAAAMCRVFYYRGQLAAARAELKRVFDDVERRKAESEKLVAAADSRFAELAAKALASNSEALRRSSVNSLSEALEPMKENIENFRRTIAERYDKEARERYALGDNIAKLIELNKIVGAETARLSSALKGNARVQGQWGEMILDNILSTAGFRRGFDYDTQVSVDGAGGRRLRPDVVINYAGGRHLVIDSKVSIQDYLNMMDAEGESERNKFAQAHLSSVKRHIGELASKDYQDVLGKDTFDYVLMFIPNEGAFFSAMNLDKNLWQLAYQSRVLIISPTLLLAVVKLIEQMWRQDKQNRNALAIADEASKMLDKFVGFVDDLGRVGRSMEQAHNAWEDAMGKLSKGPGNLIGKARKISELGAKSKKSLPEADEP